MEEEKWRGREGTRKRSVRKGRGERGAIAAAEGGEVTAAEEKRGSERERDRFTIYA